MIIQYALIVLLGMLEVYGFIMLIDVFLSWAPRFITIESLV